MEHFINHGYGWTCLRCERAETTSAPDKNARARFFSEGEAEEREIKLSAASLARWRDASRQTLICPRCGVSENLND